MIPASKDSFSFPPAFKCLTDPSYKHQTNYLVEMSPEKMIGMTNNVIMSELSLFQRQMKSDCFAIQKSYLFDTMYTLIRGFSDTLSYKSMEVLQELFRLIIDWTNSVIKISKNVIHQLDLQQLRSSLKMILFLGFYLVDTAINSRKQIQSFNEKLKVLMESSKKRKKEVVNVDLSPAAVKFQLSLIYNLIKSLNELDLGRLWEEGQVQDSFYMYYYNMGRELITNSMTKDDTLRRDVNEMLNRVLLLKPDLVKPIRKDIIKHVLKSDTQCDRIIDYFFKCPPSDSLTRQVIVEILPFIVNNPNSNNQNQQTKNISLFINKLSEKFPQIFLDYFDHFKNLYDCQSYTLRNSMTSIIYFIVKSIFNEPTEQKRKYKESLVSLLLERVYDKNTHSRSYTLATLYKMIQDNILPIQIVKEVYKTAMERMNDISVNPRKRATALVYKCSEKLFIIFGYDKNTKLMKIPEIKKELQNININLQSLETLINQSQQDMGEDADEERLEQIRDNLSNHEIKRKENRELAKRYQLFIKILEAINSTLPILQCLLNSTNIADITQTVKLVILFKKADIENIDSVVVHIWRLIFHHNKDVINEVIDCFKQLYFEEGQFNSQNLIRLFATANSKQLICFEKIIEFIMSKSNIDFGGFNIHTIDRIWTRFKDLLIVHKDSPYRARERQAVIKLLLVLFENNHSFIKLNYIAYSLSYIEEHLRDPSLKPSAQTMMFFFKIVKHSNKDLDWKLKQHFIFQTMPLVWTNTSYPIHVWCKVLETLVDVGFVVCPHPEKFLKTILDKLLQISEQERKKFKLGEKNDVSMINSNLRLYFFLGQMVGRLNELSYDLCELTRQVIQKGTNQVRKKWEEVMAKTSDEKEKNRILDQITSDTQAVEYEGNYIIKEIQAKTLKLVESESLKQWVAETVNCVKKIIKSGSDGSAIEKIHVLNFGKFMTCSFTFAKQYAKQLVALMTKCLDESIKINCIVIFSDAIAQNSSALSPYIGGLLHCILDSSRRVQITALNAMWYLIMSDILLFQSHVSYMAIVFQTQSEEIKEYCKRFLLQKNKKDKNFLLRKLTETVNELSEETKTYGNKRITPKTFQAYAREILPEIQKVKEKAAIQQATDSLLSNIKGSLTPLVVSNSCLALSLLYHNERSLMKILESYKTTGIKLKEEECVGYFKDLVARIRRVQKNENKGEMKNLVDELEAKFVHHSNSTMFFRKPKKGIKNENKSLKGNEKPKKKPVKKNKKNQYNESDDDEEDFVEESDEESSEMKRGPRRMMKKGSPSPSEGSEEELVSSRFTAGRTRAARRAARSAQIIEVSDDD